MFIICSEPAVQEVMLEPEGGFNNIAEERDYYKELAIKYEKKFREMKLELEEFQESSRELEAELEMQLEQTDARNKELKTLTNHLQIECEALKEKLQKTQHDSRKQVADLEDDLSRVRAQRDDLQKYIRELEQLNDDLERAKRATVSSLEDFEARLNQAIERNAFLESELDEKEALKITVQRLKDESRDLRQEMVVHHTAKPVYDGTYPLANGEKTDRIAHVDSNKIQTELEDTNLYSVKSVNQLDSSVIPFTPSSRISALNIVGDLLRKVGALESKLASCRTYMKDLSPKSEKDENESNLMSPLHSRRLSKGSPLTSPHDCISLVA